MRTSELSRRILGIGAGANRSPDVVSAEDWREFVDWSLQHLCSMISLIVVGKNYLEFAALDLREQLPTEFPTLADVAFCLQKSSPDMLRDLLVRIDEVDKRHATELSYLRSENKRQSDRIAELENWSSSLRIKDR